MRNTTEKDDIQESQNDPGLITLKNMKKNYDGRTVLQIDNLEFERNRIIAILGPNGSGKTTLFRIMAGIEKADEGEIHLNGKISYLTQEIYLFDLTVMGNMTIAIGKDKIAYQKAITALDKVNMTAFCKCHPKNLSGGERQRVAIARTLVQNSEIVLLDEPAASVDTLSTRLVENYILETKKETKATIFFTTHNPSQALRIADEVIILWNGIPIERGTPEQVLHNPKEAQTKEFLQNWRI